MTYSRSMIARVTLPQSVGFLGKEHNVMVVHMHNELANLVHGVKKLEVFWGWFSEKIQEFKVQVLMGDFNMSLFRVIPELRSRGAVIDLGAWYPWKSLEGEPMSDSCGIFFVNLPGVYTLTKSLRDIHGDNVTGILARGKMWATSQLRIRSQMETTPQHRRRAKTLATMKTSHPAESEALTA